MFEKINIDERAIKVSNEVRENLTYLHIRISDILEEGNNFIFIDDLKNKLNNFQIYTHYNNIKEKDIVLEVLKHSNKFHYINGLVIDIKEDTFYRIKKYHDYIKNLLNPYFNNSDIQYIVSFLFFYKRLNEKDRHKLHDLQLTSFKFEGERKEILIKNLNEFHDYYAFDINLIDDFINYLQNINFDILDEIFYILEQLDTTKYNHNEFGMIYEYFIDKEIEHNFTNKSMQKLMLKFFKLESTKTVFNPFSGIGGLSLETLKNNPNILLSNNEINARTLQLGFMTIYISGYFDTRFNKIDSLSSYNYEETYDYIITELPLARKLTQSELNSSVIQNIKTNNPIGHIRTKESIIYYLIYALSKINNHGKAIFNIPTGFLFYTSSDYIKVRKYLVENDLIEAIINLPSGTMYHSGISTALMIVNKNKDSNDKNKIKIINANLLYELKTKNKEIINESIIDIENVMESYIKETKNSTIITIDDISTKNYRLDPSIFRKEILELQKTLKDGKSKYLKDIVIITKGKNINKKKLSKQGTFPIVKIQNLHSDVVDLYINSDDNFDMLEDISSKDIICEKCILIASVGGQIKTTIYKPTEKLPNVFITTNIIALIPTKEISIEYLYYQMYSKIVTEQIKNITSGSIRMFLTMTNLNELIIPYVKREEQNKYIGIQKSSIIAEQRAELDSKLKLMGYKEKLESKESDIVRTLVHQLRATLTTINMEVSTLKSIIKFNNIGKFKNKDLNISDNDFQKPDDYTLDEISDKIHQDSKKLHDNLTTVNKVMSFKLEKEDFITHDISKFFKEYIKNKVKEIDNKYTINLKSKSINLDFNKESFTEMLDQLLINAEKHAFISKDNYKIDFNIRENKSTQIVTIEYYNNGKKFNVSEQDYFEAFTKGQSSEGSGIGGNFIYRIIDAHNGQIFIDTKNEKGFKFKIEIPFKYNGEMQ